MTRRITKLVLPLFFVLALLLLLTSAVCQPLPVSAATPLPVDVWVCQTGDCGHPGFGYNSLQAAVDSVWTGGTVYVDAGNYVGGATLYRDITIDGAGATLTVVHGASRVFTITLGTAVLSNLSITGGSDMYEGGGIYVSSLATATLDTCWVYGNSVEYTFGSGGGISNRGRLSILDSEVYFNQAGPSNGSGVGGGIANWGSLDMHDTAVYGNVVGSYQGVGGGIANFGNVSIEGGGINDNYAGQAGGGICNWGSLSILDGELEENSTEMFGGGLANGYQVFITGTQFTDNLSGYVGGGLANGFESPNTVASLLDVTFDGNSVQADEETVGSMIPGGGGLVNGAAAWLLGTNVTFTQNSAFWDGEYDSGFAAGGGLYNMYGAHTTLDVVYCYENDADKGACAANLMELNLDTEDDAPRPGSSLDRKNWLPRGPLGGTESIAQDGPEVSAAAPTEVGDTSWLTMTHAWIEDNEAEQCGGGILNTYWLPDPSWIEFPYLHARLALLDSVLLKNEAGLLGGGISNGSEADVVNSWIQDNSAGLGGGINNSNGGLLTLLWYIYSPEVPSAPATESALPGISLNLGAVPPEVQQDEFGPPGVITLTNSVLSCNWADGVEDGPIGDMPGLGGGMMNLYGDGRLTNVTFYGNEAGSYSPPTYDWLENPGGALFNLNGYLTMTNGLVWGNGPFPTVMSEGLDGEEPPMEITYSDIELEEGVWPGIGNINADPLFVDPVGEDEWECTEDDDLRLSVGSPAINAGNDLAVPQDLFDLDGDLNRSEQLPIDLGGAPRFVGVVDMGAYESEAGGLEIDKSDLKDPLPATWKIYYTIRVTSTSASTLYNLLVTDTLPAGTYFVSADMGGVGSAGSPVVTWVIASLDPGAVLELQVVLGSYRTTKGLVVNQVEAAVGGLSVTASEDTTITEPPPALPTPTPTPTATPKPTPLPFWTLDDGEDTYIYRYAPDTRFWLAPLLKVGYKQTNSSLIRFDLSQIPPGSTVDEAWLEVYAAGWSGPGSDITVGAYAISATIVVSETTWNEAFENDAWHAPGCNDEVWDRRPLPEYTLTTSGPLKWYRFDLTALLQEWLDGSPLNNGVLLRQEIILPYAFFFASAEYPDPVLHPRLVVRYH